MNIRFFYNPIEEGKADVVYGSRFLGAPHRVTMFWHLMANRLLTFMTNILYNTILTDMETGYKVFRREVIDNIKIRCQTVRFRAGIHGQGVEAQLSHFRSAHLLQPT